jgi:hypothetical protein
MRKVVLVCCCLPLYCFGQIATDSLKITVVKDSIVEIKSSWYARSMLLSLTTGSDTKGETLSERVSQNIEIGRSIGSIDLGISLGQFNHSIIDSCKTRYAEFRLNLDACQIGIFSNEISVGAGYVFQSKTPVLLEITSTIFAQIHENFGLGFVFGNIDFVGDYNDMNKSFFGLYLRYGLERSEGGILTNKIKILQNNSRHHRKKLKLF